MRRLPPLLLIVAYLGATAYFFALHVLGDSQRHPAGYFWTWDMYPGYETASARRIVIARTASGRWLRLLPDETQRFRLHGETGDRDADGLPIPRGYSRIDLNRHEAFLRRAVANAVERQRRDEPPDGVVWLAVVDAYWPVRFNRADDAGAGAGADSDAGQAGAGPFDPAPRRVSWRVAARAAVGATGEIEWQAEGAER